MTGSDLWAENEILRQRFLEMKSQLEREHEERLKLKAENLWLKRLLEEQAPVAGPTPRGGSVTRIF